MPYTTNKNLPKIRQEAVQLLRRGWSARRVGRYLGFHHTAVMSWLKQARLIGNHPIPTKSSRPKSHPRELSGEIVRKIVQKRLEHNRYAEAVHQELKNEGVTVSLSSVKRTLDRHGLIKKRSPYKRYHPPSRSTICPEIRRFGANRHHSPDDWWQEKTVRFHPDWHLCSRDLRQSLRKNERSNRGEFCGGGRKAISVSLLHVAIRSRTGIWQMVCGENTKKITATPELANPTTIPISKGSIGLCRKNVWTRCQPTYEKLIVLWKNICDTTITKEFTEELII